MSRSNMQRGSALFYTLLEPEPTSPPELDGTEQIVPDGSQDVEIIGNLNFIRMFLSGKLAIPGEKTSYFGYEDLEDVDSLGNGTYGTVRKMRHNDTGVEIAVKRVRITSSGLDDVGVNRSMKRLKQEVDAIQAASNCDNIVQFFGLTFHEGDAWVCMELMDISLEHLYRTAKRQGHELFDEITMGAVAVSAIQGLIHMKEQYHIIHRDVKPSNILLCTGGKVKLCDFGICGYLQDSVAQTKEAGCRPYMAPERLSTASKEYDIRSDVWSLGISMVEVANFAFPYPGFLSAPLFAQLQMVVYGDPPMIKNQKYSTMMRNFVNQCVIKDKMGRPTFAELQRTPYYKHYAKIKTLHYQVAGFVMEMLPHYLEWKVVDDATR